MCNAHDEREIQDIYQRFDPGDPGLGYRHDDSRHGVILGSADTLFEKDYDVGQPFDVWVDEGCAGFQLRGCARKISLHIPV